MKCEIHRGLVNMTLVEFPADDCPHCKADALRKELEDTKKQKESLLNCLEAIIENKLFCDCVPPGMDVLFKQVISEAKRS